MREQLTTGEVEGSYLEALDVALLVESEVLVKGMEVLMSTLDRVGSVRLWNPEELEKSLDSEECDVLIVTVKRWGLLDGMEEDYRRRMPRVLVLGSDPLGSGHGFSALPSGGFLATSGLSSTSLDDALRRVTADESAPPAQPARRLLSGIPPSCVGGGRAARLTPREQETLTLLANGLSNKQIARSLGISTHGVKRLVGAILLKLGSPNRTAAVVTAMQIGLL
ncbi:response regulator transcription factor [Streptomyces sp. NPDC050619]|uniref:helix-turn-helix transcriptional regulator n=1 Tax=Streptomyces sp. NPDC050619 TaxID=3157214 RepID=UPI00343D9A7F